MHIWIPHEILSILSVRTSGQNEITPQHIQNFRRLGRQMGINYGPDLLNISDILRGGGGGLVSKAAAGRPPWARVS